MIKSFLNLLTIQNQHIHNSKKYFYQKRGIYFVLYRLCIYGFSMLVPFVDHLLYLCTMVYVYIIKNLIIEYLFLYRE